MFAFFLSVWEGVNFSIAGGGPYTANLTTLKDNIRRVMHHRAILGCDFECALLSFVCVDMKHRVKSIT